MQEYRYSWLQPARRNIDEPDKLRMRIPVAHFERDFEPWVPDCLYKEGPLVGTQIPVPVQLL